MSDLTRIALLTDFGTRDGYVGVMKGVMAAIAPGVRLDDVSHEILPGDVAGAARALGRYWRLWPRGTVHLVVVDPGVGTRRRALAVEAEGRFLVAPDNGALTPVFQGAPAWRAVELSDPAYHRSIAGVPPEPGSSGQEPPFTEEHLGPSPRRLPGPSSRTFHGRDIFAPVAARLAAGVDPGEMGPEVKDPVRLPEPEPRESSWGWEGEVLAGDRFGNLLTNLAGELLAGVSEVEVAGRRVPVGEVYGEVPPGGLLALVNSDGRVEVAVRDGSALDLLGAEPGMAVKLLRKVGGATT
jgi:S-adenosyl-L-methionine hydrolase (adenosine-forming)